MLPRLIRLPRHLGRAVTVTVTAAALLLAAALPSGAVPTTQGGGDPAVVASWPTDLQQLVAGTPAFTSAPWFTEGDCQGRGGDVSRYINTYFQREAAFRQQMMAELIKGNPDLQDLGIQAPRPQDDQVFPNGDAAYNVAPGVCAADLQQWGTPDASSPWGFSWVARPDDGSLRRMTAVGGQDIANPLTVCSDDPDSYLCSRAFFVNCDQADTAGKQRCLDWNVSVQQHLNGMAHWIDQNKSVLDRVGDFFSAVGHGLWTAGAWVVSGLGWVLGKVGDAIGWVAKKGMEQVVAFFTSGAVWLWGQVTAWMINSTTPNLATGGFVDTYNLISGVMLAMAFLIWLAGLVTAWRRGRLTGSIIGAVKAIVGIQIVGIIAYLMLQLANQATLGLISGQQRQIANSDFTASLLQVNPVVGLIAAVLTILGLIGAGLVLVFQAPLTLGHALFGTVAAAGQAHAGTSHWMGRWFIKLLSLAWCKFFMVGMTILAQNLLTSTSANMQQNFGQQLFSVLSGMLLMLLLPTTPWLLSGVMSFTVGHTSAAGDAMAQKMTAAAGMAALKAAPAAGAASAGAAHAMATMGNNLVALGELGNGTFGTGDGRTYGEMDDDQDDGGGDAGGAPALPAGDPPGVAPGGGAAGGTAPGGGGESDGDGSPAGDTGGKPDAGGCGDGAPTKAPGAGGTAPAGAREPPPDPQDADLEAPEDLHTAAGAGAAAAGAAATGGAAAAATAGAGTRRRTGATAGRRSGSTATTASNGDPTTDGIATGTGAAGSAAAASTTGSTGTGPSPQPGDAPAPAGAGGDGQAAATDPGTDGATVNGHVPGGTVNGNAARGTRNPQARRCGAAASPAPAQAGGAAAPASPTPAAGATSVPAPAGAAAASTPAPAPSGTAAAPAPAPAPVAAASAALPTPAASPAPAAAPAPAPAPVAAASAAQSTPAASPPPAAAPAPAPAPAPVAAASAALPTPAASPAPAAPVPASAPVAAASAALPTPAASPPPAAAPPASPPPPAPVPAASVSASAQMTAVATPASAEPTASPLSDLPPVVAPPAAETPGPAVKRPRSSSPSTSRRPRPA
ncbi:hypothetical protein [Nakamurella endophytica]|uniref:TrbL/VirB6 plasmid conjugal transfer protein n=1 Tax=Nakamurella endophytica TaxID=1748367 RepID=A0A917T3W6_9ACTN|nr:hypothetical protein [Nakamurella endophytica]GGM09977.1 hypothetical protein GCM10011594_32350 [Nakamurella endophytica]